MAARFAFKSHLPTSVGAFGFQARRTRHAKSGLDSINHHFPRLVDEVLSGFAPDPPACAVLRKITSASARAEMSVLTYVAVPPLPTSELGSLV